MADRYVPIQPDSVIASLNTVFGAHPAIATLGNGGFVVAWADHGPNFFDNDIIRIQRFDANGNEVGGPVEAAQGRSLSPNSQPSVAALASGGFIVTWSQYSSDSGTYSADIRGQIFDASGARSGGAIEITGAAPLDQSDSHATGLANGNFVVTWTDERSVFGPVIDTGPDIHSQLFDAGGQKIGAENRVTFTVNDQTQPDITALAGGGYVITWDELTGADSSAQVVVRGQSFNANGSPAGDIFSLVIPANRYFTEGSSVVAETDGGFVVGWAGRASVGALADQLLTQRFDAAGHQIGGETAVRTDTSYASYQDPDFARLGDDQLVAVSDDFMIEARVFSLTGVQRGITTNVSEISSVFDAAVVTGLGIDKFAVAWSSDSFVSGSLFDTLNVQVFSFAANTVPVAGNDVAQAVRDTPLRLTEAGLLANDISSDGDTLRITALANPTHGTAMLGYFEEPSGSFFYGVVFTPEAGYAGEASFDYTVSDGYGGTDTATVRIAIASSIVLGDGDDTYTVPGSSGGVVNAGGGNDMIFGGSGDDIIDGGPGRDAITGGAGNDILTGGTGNDRFVFDNIRATGRDRITDFGPGDVIATSVALADNNRDGIIGFGDNHVLDLTTSSGNQVTIGGIDALRYLGSSDGAFYYADAATRPLGGSNRHVIEDRIGGERLAGSSSSSITDIFFVDSALGLALGADAISNFGNGDLLVTTSALRDGNRDGIITFGAGGILNIAPGTSATLTGNNGVAIDHLEFDGIVAHGETHYYVYSLQGSAVGTAQLVIG